MGRGLQQGRAEALECGNGGQAALARASRWERVPGSSEGSAWTSVSLCVCGGAGIENCMC